MSNALGWRGARPRSLALRIAPLFALSVGLVVASPLARTWARAPIAGVQSDGTVFVRPSAYDARVLEVRHESAALGTERSFHIFLPPEAADAALRFPALYLFRGHFREWVNKAEDASRGQRNVVDVYEGLRAEGAIEPMILVFPGVSAESRDVHSCGVNMLAPGNTPTIGTGRFEDYLVEDLIPYCDSRFPTIADRSKRGVDGYSLGGAVSVKLALQHPELFSTVGALDAPYWFADKRRPGSVSKKDELFHDAYFDAAYGRPRDYAFAGANSALVLLGSVDASVVESLTWMIEYGPKGTGGYDRGKKLVKLVKAKGGRNELRGAVSPFVHDWRHADEHLERSLPLHGRAFAESD
jgi:S-formylglutathione hydrolase FrmB